MAGLDINLRKCFTFIWKIEYANSYYDEKVLCSPEFEIDEIGEKKFQLVYKYASSKGKSVVIELMRTDRNKELGSIEINYELAVFVDGKLSRSRMKTKRVFSSDDLFDTETIKRKEWFYIFKPARQDILTIRCRVWKSAGELSKNVRCISRTYLEALDRSFMWNVGNLKNFKPNERRSFEIKSISTLEVLLTLEIFLTDGAIFLFSVTRINHRICFSSFKLSLLEASGNTVESLEEKFTFDKLGDSKVFEQGFLKERLIGNENVYLDGDILSIRGECTFSFGNILNEIKEILSENPTSDSNEDDSLLPGEQNVLSSSKRDLIDNLKLMMNTGCHSDIKLRTRTKTYPAHKCILSSRSPVFKAMFGNEMKEKIDNSVYIEDFNEDTVSRMLQYIYSADVTELDWISATELYEAADKYFILSLKDICSSYLKKNLHKSNACEVLVLADLHQDKDLKVFVQDFIITHGELIINSEEWQKMMESHLKLAAETMCLKFKKSVK